MTAIAHCGRNGSHAYRSVRAFQLAVCLGSCDLTDGIGQGIGVLGAHDRVFSFEQEAGHTGDAHA